MSFLSSTPETQKKMLNKIQIETVDQLFKIVPDKIRLKNPMNIQSPMAELEITDLMNFLSKKSNPANNGINFLGSGIYDHFIPAAVDFISSRSEFYTAYTPYQPEVSQGTLQSLYEFQTMICELSGMDVANASLYDGASALSEACILAATVTRKQKILVSNSVYSHYINVLNSLRGNNQIKIETLPILDCVTDLSKITDLDNVAAVIIQSPNKFGILEDWKETAKILSNCQSNLIAVSNPLMLNLIEAPGNCGADIYIGEGQSLGNPINYGGPCLGLMAVKSNLIRRIPGRIIGRTVDKSGEEGFVLTLQTREQHIRRENAASNICTNQGLLALRATLYMTLLGKYGMKEVAELCYKKTQYLINEIENINGYSVPYGENVLMEFVIKTPISAIEIASLALKQNIFINTIKISEVDYLLVAVTEKRTIDDINKFIQILKSFK